MSSQIDVGRYRAQFFAGHSRSRGPARGVGPTCTMATSGPRRPPRKLATSSIGFCVAESPMRSGGSRSSADQGARAEPVLSAHQRIEPLQGERQVGAALVIGHRMNFIDNYRLTAAQIFSALLRCQQDVERLRRGDQDVWRPLAAWPGVPRAVYRRCAPRSEWRAQVSAFQGQFLNLPQRRLEVLLHIVAERFERGDVDHSSPRQASPRWPCGSACRYRSGTRPAFCPNLSEPKSVSVGPRGSVASPVPAARSAFQTGSEPFPHQRMRPGQRADTSTAGMLSWRAIRPS